MHKGKKIVEGEVNSLLDPSKTIVKIETANNQNAFELLTNSIWSEDIKFSNEQILLKIAKKDVPFLSRFLIENNVDVYMIQPLHSLENYFLNLTKSTDHVESFTN